MNKLFKKIVGVALGLTMAIGVGVAVASNSKEASPVHAAVTYEQLTSIANIDESAQYVLGVEGTGSGKGFHKSGTSSWGVCTTKDSETPLYYTLKKGANNANFTAKTTVSGTIYYLQVPTSNNFSMDTSSTAANTTLIIGTTTVSSTNYAVANSDTPTRHLRINGTSGLRSYAGTTGSMAFFYKVVSGGQTLSSISVATAPTKTSYLEGEYFSPSGLVITRTYSGSTSDTYAYAGHTSEFTFSPSTSTALTTSNTSVTITYGGKSTSQAITVTAPKTPASVSSFGQTTTFDSGDTFAYGGTLTATYTDSTSKTVSPTSFKIGNAGISPTSAGTVITPGSTVLSRDDHNGKTVYVLYTENNTTVCTSYVITVNKISKITLDPTVTSSFPYQGITLTVTDGTLTNNNDYRVYKNQTMTITSTVGDMAKIEFTYSSASNDGGGWSSAYTPNANTWTSPTAKDEQARITKIIVTLASADPLVELDVSSATSVDMLDGDTDSTVKILAKNIDDYTAWALTFDEDGDTGLGSSDYVTVVPGAFSNNVSTFAITAKKVGSTILNIQLDGTDCENTVKITIGQKPASITITHTDVYEKDNKLQLDLIAGGAYKQMTFSGKDIRGNKYAVAAADVTPSIQSGSSYVTVSGTRITPKSTAGQAVVTYKLNDLTSVCVDLTVNVVDDYIETIGTPTFATDLTDTQGQSPTVSVFTSRPGTLYSGSSTTVPFENFKFSYDQTYASAQYGSVFSYDFSHGTTVDSTHKLQTIYVFCDIDEVVHGSYTVTVEQLNDPLQTISFTDPANHALSIIRGGSYQLKWEYSPANPTDGKEVEFVIDTNANNIDITVSLTGSVSIGSTSNLGTAKVLIQSAHDDTIQDYVNITATLETMKYTVSEEESLTPVSTVSSGDRVYMVVDNGTKTYEFSGLSSTSTVYGEGAEYTTTIAKLQLLIVEEGASSGTVAFKMSDGNYLNWSSGNSLTSVATKNNNTSWTVNGSTITNANDTKRQLWWNNGSPRFACYTDKTSTTGYYCPTFVKVTGGNTPYTVTETLFNGVQNNFGTGKTYEWDASCSNFDDEAWFDACDALMSITDYSNYKLNRAVANISGNEIEVFLAKYDAIIGKFGTTHDYLDRFAQGGINGVRSGVSPLVNIIGENTNTVAIIVIISMVSVTAIGGYFFYKKRKEV